MGMMNDVVFRESRGKLNVREGGKNWYEPEGKYIEFRPRLIVTPEQAEKLRIFFEEKLKHRFDEEWNVYNAAKESALKNGVSCKDWMETEEGQELLPPNWWNCDESGYAGSDNHMRNEILHLCETALHSVLKSIDV